MHLSCKKFALATVAVLLASVSATSSVGTVGPRQQVVSDPGGVGGVPFSSSAHVVMVPTAGLLLDSSRSPIGGAVVTIAGPLGGCIGTAITATDGTFTCLLPNEGLCTLSLPALGVFDIPVDAGVPVLIVVP